MKLKITAKLKQKHAVDRKIPPKKPAAPAHIPYGHEPRKRKHPSDPSIKHVLEKQVFIENIELNGGVVDLTADLVFDPPSDGYNGQTYVMGHIVRGWGISLKESQIDLTNKVLDFIKVMGLKGRRGSFKVRIAFVCRKAGCYGASKYYPVADYPTKEDVESAYSYFVRDENRGKDSYDGLWPENLKFSEEVFEDDDDAEEFNLSRGNAVKWHSASVCQSKADCPSTGTPGPTWVVSAWIPD